MDVKLWPLKLGAKSVDHYDISVNNTKKISAHCKNEKNFVSKKEIYVKEILIKIRNMISFIYKE